jgi:late competence protein required for DNA uptake (superfamily II DNA/RNA helicase)
MSPASYGKWCIKNDKNKTHIKVCCDIVRQTFEKNENSKVIIFMPLIELCEETADFIYKKLSHDDSFPYDIRIRTINSRNSKVENERNKQSDVIVSTTGSLSTGVDIKGITTIISCSPMVSKIQCVQTWGRIRYGGVGFTGDYYDIIDSSCLMDTIWQKSRYKVFKNLALNINHYYWTLDDSDNEESVT